MKRKYKVIVAHPGKQHSFRLATAINRTGILDAYITTVYDKDSILMKAVKRFLGNQIANRASTRKCAELKDDQVIQFCEFRSMITLLLVRIDKSKKLYSRWNRYVSAVFGRKVAKYAIKKQADMVILYDSNAAECSEILSKKAPNILRVMDVSHSNRLYEKELFEKDMMILPEWADNLKREKSYLWEDSLDFIRLENQLTQFFLVPSSYVKRTLTSFGTNGNYVSVIPYGVDTSKFTFFPDEQKEVSDLYFLYVGNATEMKGFGHLLKAFQLVNEKYPGTNLHFVGGIVPEVTNERYGNHVISHGYLQFDEMAEVYRHADVMLFPSLSEGMTLSGLEALCSVVPIVCTTNSGINDLIVDGENGFIIEVSNYKQLAQKIIWFIEHKDRIPEMKQNAHLTGIQYSWERYYTSIGKTIMGLLQGEEYGSNNHC